MRLLPLAALALVAAGCDAGKVPVKGKLVWSDGSPATELAGSQVVFDYADLKTSARGTVAADGTFTLSTADPGDGVPAGRPRVYVLESRRSLEGGEGGGGLEPAKMDPKYGDLATSGLEVTVGRGTPDVTVTVERVKRG